MHEALAPHDCSVSQTDCSNQLVSSQSFPSPSCAPMVFFNAIFGTAGGKQVDTQNTSCYPLAIIRFIWDRQTNTQDQPWSQDGLCKPPQTEPPSTPGVTRGCTEQKKDERTQDETQQVTSELPNTKAILGVTLHYIGEPTTAQWYADGSKCHKRASRGIYNGKFRAAYAFTAPERYTTPKPWPAPWTQIWCRRGVNSSSVIRELSRQHQKHRREWSRIRYTATQVTGMQRPIFTPDLGPLGITPSHYIP